MEDEAERERLARFGRELAAIMRQRGISERQLGEAIGVSQNRISNYLGKERPPFDRFFDIDRALGLRRGELLLRGGWVEPAGVVASVIADKVIAEHHKQTLLDLYEMMSASAAPPQPVRKSRRKTP